jgi:hypothetical protein
MMPDYDPFDADGDPFRPPAIPTLVTCLHCGQSYESYRIEWRVEMTHGGELHGFWCCPITGCDGKGFGFDILPVDPHYQDENGGWIWDDDGSNEDVDGGEVPDPDAGAERQKRNGEEESLPG